jgi:type II secretory pathway pseudopilin PulG
MLTATNALRRVRARVHGDDPEAGISLTELIVTMSLMSIVAALALNWLLGATSASTKTTNSSFATSDARNVLLSWPALLRVADAPLTSSSTSPAPPVSGAGTSTNRFQSITPTSISFNADLGNRPTSCTPGCSRGPTTLVTLSIVPVTVGGTATNKLVQTLTTSTGKVSSVTVVASGAGRVPNATGTGSACLFTTYDQNGNKLNPSCSTSTPLASIARVDLAFTVTPTDGSTVGGTLQTFQTSTQITGTFPTAPTSSATTTGVSP